MSESCNDCISGAEHSPHCAPEDCEHPLEATIYGNGECRRCGGDVPEPLTEVERLRDALADSRVECAMAVSVVDAAEQFRNCAHSILPCRHCADALDFSIDIYRTAMKVKKEDAQAAAL